MVTGEGSRPVSAEQRLKELGIKLPAAPEPFGAYVEAVQTGNLLFLSGMLPTEGRSARFTGRVGAELDVDAAREAAKLAALNVLGVARQHLGSLDKVTRIVRLGVSVATSVDVREKAKVADAASELLQDVFGKDKSPCRLVYGVASADLLSKISARTSVPLPRNVGRTGTSQRPNLKQSGSKAARNSSIRTAKCTSKLSVSRIRRVIALATQCREPPFGESAHLSSLWHRLTGWHPLPGDGVFGRRNFGRTACAKARCG
jgi:enamine deaminase RidA (YjgF/YER057c/UK114 family)